MGSLHFFRDPPPAHNFHNDQSLHDKTTAVARPWYKDLGVDAYAILRNFPIYRKSGKEQYAKYIASDLDLDNALSKLISKKLVTLLWGSLIHPPASYRGNEYRYRMADGSNNSVLYPHLGKAGLPYAKSVPNTRSQYGARPDPGDIFDLLMARDDEGVESSSGISMMLLYHATVIIHDIFRTDDQDSNLSVTSSYLDLAPLYGSDIDTQRSVRQMRDGLLKIDTFAETRLLNQPPGVCIYIILYNRFHNYVAKQLKDINEHGRFSLPPGCDGSEEARKNPKWTKAFELQDENLFQTARLITCGMYINIAIHDYLKCLMGVHTLDTPWTLDPRKPLPETDNAKGLSRGEGNMVSAEFNLLYRFHSPISRRDAQWSEELFVQLLQPYIDDSDSAAAKEARAKGEKFTTAQIKNGEFPTDKFKQVLDNYKNRPRDTTKLFPPGLDLVGTDFAKAKGDTKLLYRFQRNAEGYFNDAQMAAELCRAIEDPICQFGARQVPKIFKAIEVMGVLQARKWEIATLNEYREFFGMSRFSTFEEINSDPQIQERLRYLYEDPDLVEFYPGLFVEGQGRNIDPGTSLPNGASSSLWRGVFSDAVTLVRSDRFYTLDWNVGSLTAWGMNEVTSNPKVNKGSVMHRLFQRALPGCFEYNSIHMWQPFYTPQANIILAKEQGYLNFLDLSGLEDKNGNPHIFVKGSDETFYGKNHEKFNVWQQTIKNNGVRRKLAVGSGSTLWRGNEYVEAKTRPAEVTSFKTITSEILGGPNSKNWASQVILEPTDVPYGALRDIMTKQWNHFPKALEIVEKTLPADWEQVFMDYFTGLAQDIRHREQRALQTKLVQEGTSQIKQQIYQLDIVKDLAIPVVTRFLADLIGFWDQVKTPEHGKRKFDENEIYEHIENCQNFDAYDSDPTKTWQRRMAFQTSIKVLKSLADHGVGKYRRGWFENLLWRRTNGSQADGKYVQALRKIGVDLTQALLRRFDSDAVAAVMLHTALDAAQRFVLIFAESMAWFVDPTTREKTVDGKKVVGKDEQTKHWIEFKNLAWQDTMEVAGHPDGKTKPKKDGRSDPEITAQLKQYVLEVSRLSNPLDLVRIYKPKNGAKSVEIVTGYSPTTTTTVKAKESVLLNLRLAYDDPASGITDPDTFQLRPLSSYITFGPTVSTTKPPQTTPPTFSKRAALIGLTGLIKHCSQLSSLRVAHDKAGRLKRVTTPLGIHRYASPKWDRLLAFPTTWNVRYDGVGKATYIGGDNTDQGNAQNLLFEYESLVGLDGEDERLQKEEQEKEERKKEQMQRAGGEIDGALKRVIEAALEKGNPKVVAETTTTTMTTTSTTAASTITKAIKTLPAVYTTEVAADAA